MKFNCDKRKMRKQKQREWHDWFAWRPVKVGYGDCRWLEVVERRVNRTYLSGYGHTWVDTERFYRPKEK